MLKFFAFVLLVSGAVTVYLAKWIVGRFQLEKKVSCDFEEELSTEELEQYKSINAIARMKMLGMLIVLPGLVLFILEFKMK